MQVFLSWSGERSKAMAETFAEWIGQVIQAVEPWISSDIEKGSRWGPEVAGRLEACKVGIICLTRENLDANWILFEAGALSKTKDAHVCTLLLDIAPSDIEQPLGQFQHTTRAKAEMLQLVQTINEAVHRSGERALAEATLKQVFETNYPHLSAALDRIAAQKPDTGSSHRPEREILQEILEIVRGQERQRLDDIRARERIRSSTLAEDSANLGAAFKNPPNLDADYLASLRRSLLDAQLLSSRVAEVRKILLGGTTEAELAHLRGRRLEDVPPACKPEPQPSRPEPEGPPLTGRARESKKEKS